MRKKIGFIGIGHMGLPMVRNLIRGGYEVVMYDKSIDKRHTLRDMGFNVVDFPFQVISSESVLITMVPDDAALIEITTGEHGVMYAEDKNYIHVSMSTVSPVTIEQINTAYKKIPAEFIAAPVFGRPSAVENKEIYFFLSGLSSSKKQIIDILNVLGKGCYDFGEKISAAAIAKLAANFLVASAIESMAEATVLVEKNGLSSQIFMSAMTSTLFACPVYDYHAQNISASNFLPAGFSVALGMKDIDLMMQLAQTVGAVMPYLSVLWQQFISTLSKQRAHLDWASIALNARENSGL